MRNEVLEVIVETLENIEEVKSAHFKALRLALSIGDIDPNWDGALNPMWVGIAAAHKARWLWLDAQLVHLCNLDNPRTWKGTPA